MQGVRIPALGSFDVVSKWVKVGNETIIFLKPVFYMARNLIVSHNLMDNKEYLPGKRVHESLAAWMIPSLDLRCFSEVRCPLHGAGPKPKPCWVMTAMSSTWGTRGEGPLVTDSIPLVWFSRP